MPRCLPSLVILGAFLRASRAALCNSYTLEECGSKVALSCRCEWDNVSSACERGDSCDVGLGAINTEDGTDACPDLIYQWDSVRRETCCQMQYCGEYLSYVNCFTRERWRLKKEVGCRCCSEHFQQGYLNEEGLYTRATYALPPDGDDTDDIENMTVPTTTTTVWCLSLEYVWADEDRESCCQSVYSYCSVVQGAGGAAFCRSKPDWTQAREIGCRCCETSTDTWTQGYVDSGGQWRAAAASNRSSTTDLAASSATGGTTFEPTTTEGEPLSRAAQNMRGPSVVVALMLAISGPI